MPEKPGLVFLVDEHPLPDVRDMLERVQAANQLVEVLADGIQLILQRDHVRIEIVEGPVTEVHDDRLSQHSVARVFAQ